MSPVGMALLLTLVVSVLVQAFLVRGFANLLRRPAPSRLPDDRCPYAAVVLCLRGDDPFLDRCIRGLIQQDYPSFQVTFLVDSPSDPALSSLERALGGTTFSNYKIEFLQDRYPTCSLKCSSIIQAWASIPEGVQFIAQLDADTVPHTTWLRELAEGLQPEDVGAATGNRWYMPENSSRGALIRYVWNAAAIVQMTWYRIAWGGTLAVKAASIREGDLVERWKHALCEDTMLASQLARIGQRVAFVPSLMMVNREDCTITSFVPWVVRQLLTARLYHPAWLAVVGHGISSAAILGWGWGWACFQWIQGNSTEATIVFLSMIVFQITLAGMIPWIERAVCHVVRRRNESTTWNRPSFLGLLVAVSQTQVIYTYALLKCLWVKQVDWRGIVYRIHGPWNVKMIEYRPYANQPGSLTPDSQALTSQSL